LYGRESTTSTLKIIFMCLAAIACGCALCFAVTSVCGGCDEAVTFKKASTRPFSECPVCREGVCKPWVMEGGLWEELGGAAFGP